MKRTYIIFIVFIFLFSSGGSSFALKADNPAVLSHPDEYISITFDQAPLSEIVTLVSELTGMSILVATEKPKFLTWTEQNIKKIDVFSSFKTAIISSGLTLGQVQERGKFLTVIRDEAASIANDSRTVGFYRLRNITADVFSDTAETLYSDRLAINVLDNSNVVLFAGSYPIVQEFTFLLNRIDNPEPATIKVVSLSNIAVKNAMKALFDSKLLPEGSYTPDHWNRAILLSGTEQQKQIATALILALDKPQRGWLDQIEFVQQVDTETITEILNSACPTVTIRRIGKNCLLVSGQEADVAKASSLIHRIDGTGLQVKIEAVIAYLTDQEYLDIGGRIRFEDSSQKYAVNDALIPSIVRSNTGLLIDFFRHFGLTFAAQDGNSHGSIISAPVLTVLNGKEAHIHVGQNVPYISKIQKSDNGDNTATSVERQDLGLTFSVKPLILPDGKHVQLHVSQEVSNLASDSEISASTVDVVFDSNSISSDVIVPDQGSLFLGGLRTSTTGNAKTKIPFLSAIPGIGKLFTYTSDHKQNRHLVVSLRLTVLPSSFLSQGVLP